MAALFWVGGSTAYDGVTNRLATTSGGAATVAAITSADTVTFDANSPAAAAVATTAAISCTSLTMAAGFTGSLTLGNTLTTSGLVTHTQGTLNTNGQTCSWGSFNDSNNNVRTLTLGASPIAITSGGTVWTAGGSNFTITANTAVVTFSGAAALVNSINTNWNGLSLSFTGSGRCGFVTFAGNTWQNVTRTGTAVFTDSFQTTGTQTISGALTLNGNSASKRLLVSSQTVGTAATLNAATVSVTNADFQDITGAGVGSWNLAAITGGSGDCGGNTNITFTTPASQTWSGNTTGSWSTAANWTSRAPLPQDNVNVNALTSGTITVDMQRIGASIDFTGSTGGSITVSSPFTVINFGSFTAGTAVTFGGNTNCNLSGRGSFTLSGTFGTSGSGWSMIFTIGTTYTLNGALSTGSGTAGQLRFTSGTLITNGFTVTTAAQTGGTGTMNISNSTINCTGASTQTWVAPSTLTSTGSTIVLTDISATGKTFAGGGKTYNNLSITGGGAGAVTFTGANTFANLPQITGGTKSIIWPGSTTTTFTNGGNFGNGTNVITMTASAGSATLSFGTPVSADYLNLTNIPASTTTPAYAGTHSTDGGGNTNWVFTAAPLAASGGTMLLMGV